MRTGPALVAAAAWTTAVWTSTGVAQDAAAEAQRLNDLGIEAMEVELDFARARALFERSLSVLPTPAAAFNLGYSHFGNGSPREAIAVWSRVLTGEYGTIDDAQRQQLLVRLSEASTQVASVRVRLRAPPEARIRIDGEERGLARSNRLLDLPVNPGRHVLTASAEDHRSLERVVRLEPGGQVRLTLSLAPIETGSVFDSPWFWAIASAVAVVATVTVVLVAAGPYFEDPQSTEPFGVAMALRGP